MGSDGSSAIDQEVLEQQLDAIFHRPQQLGISLAAVVVHRGQVVAERYGVQPANVFVPETQITPDTLLTSWSMAKSMVHAAIGLLVVDGRLDVSARASVPEWAGTPKAEITILDLLEMRSGLRFVEDYVDGTASHCIDMLWGSGIDDHAAYAAALPLDHPPGTVWNYASGTTNILARIIGDIVGGGAHGMARYLSERLFEPVGMASAVPHFDPAGTWVGSSYVDATARDFAKFGELYRRDGVTAAGDRILPIGWGDHGRTWVARDDSSGIPGGLDYGRHWWTWPEFPGSIAAHGFEGQFVIVVPDRALTLVHLGKTNADVRFELAELLAQVIRSVPQTP